MGINITTGRASPGLAFVLMLPGTGWGLSPQQVYAAAAPSVAQLETQGAAGQQTGVFSATQIGPQRFVGVCEPLDTMSTVRLVIGPRTLEGKVSARDRERNLCFVDVDQPVGTVIGQADQLPAAGSRVFAISNALGLGIGISEGVVSGIRNSKGGSLIQFTAPISPGSEGGALVDDQARLVGLLDYRRRDGQNVNFAASVAWLAEVASRATQAAGQLKRVDAASALLKAGDWQPLADMARDWVHEKPDDADAWRFAAQAAAGLKDAEGELRAWEARYRLSPDELEVGLGLGEVLLTMRRDADALAHAQALVASHPADAGVFYLLARAQQHTGALREAEASFRAAIDRDAWLTGAYQGLADLASARGDSATALSIWSRLSGLYPLAAWPRFGMAQTYLNMNQPARAYAVVDKLPVKERDGAQAWYWRGRALLQVGDPEAAALAFQKSLDRKPNIEGWVYGGLGAAMWSLKRYPEAIAAAESAIARSPESDGWRYQLAVNLKNGGRAEEALGLTTALTQKMPENALYWRQHGYVLAWLGRMAESVPALERSLQLNPRQADVWASLVRSHQYLGQRKEARAVYQRLVLFDAKTAEDVYRTEMLAFEGDAP